MLHPHVQRAPILVPVPAELDLTNQPEAYDRLHAAFASGATVVVADLTATTFSDCASRRRLLAVQHFAAAHGAQLRLATEPRSMVQRLLDLLGLDDQLPVYASPAEAAADIGDRLRGHPAKCLAWPPRADSEARKPA